MGQYNITERPLKSGDCMQFLLKDGTMRIFSPNEPDRIVFKHENDKIIVGPLGMTEPQVMRIISVIGYTYGLDWTNITSKYNITDVITYQLV